MSASTGDVLPLEVWTSAVDDVSRFRPYISLTGGEPLMYPHTEALIRHVRERHMRCTLTTNGTELASRAPLLMESPPHMLIVSLDGPRDAHNAVRGRPWAYDRTVAGLAAVQELKAERARKYPFLVINCAVTSHSCDHTDELLDTASALGVSAVNFQHEWSLTPAMVQQHNAAYGDCHTLSGEHLGAADPPSVDPAHMVETVGRIRRRAASLEDDVVVTFHPSLSDSEIYDWYSNPHVWVQRRPAVCAWLNTSVLPNGDVEPCHGVACGNIAERPLSQIWNGRAYKEFRRRLAAARDFPICVRCCAYFRRD